MTHWKRIILVAFMLIGGTISFGFWAFDQFNRQIDSISSYNVTSVAAVHMLSNSLSTTSDSLVIIDSISPQSSSTEIISLTATSTNISTSTHSDTENSFVEITNRNFLFTFPTQENNVYIGCTYKISWMASTSINSFNEASLVDAGTFKSSGPISSGISKEYTLRPDIQFIEWKVGNVWPGKYYISILNVNGTSTKIKSKTFNISTLTDDPTTEQTSHSCEISGGIL